MKSTCIILPYSKLSHSENHHHPSVVGAHVQPGVITRAQEAQTKHHLPLTLLQPFTLYPATTTYPLPYNL